MKKIVFLIALIASFSASADHIDKDITYTRFIDGHEDINGSYITIREQGDTINVKGFALWIPYSGIPNTGELDATVKIKYGVAHYSKDECNLVITLSIDSLVVSGDNGECGGNNVRFNGVYKKIAK